MDLQGLQNKFTQGINWNAFLFVIQKILSISLTILLFKNLSSRNFSIWANVNSVIFLLLLWLDFGFKKSIPRFVPEFLKRGNTWQFVQSIVFFKAITLLFATPLFFFVAQWFATALHITDFLLLASVLFVVEGAVSVFRLVFHSYFLQKRFNLLVSVVLTAQMGINLVSILLYTTGGQLLYAIFITKIISGVVVIVMSSFMLPHIINKKFSAKKNKNKIKWGPFAKHSSIMWTTNTIKSLTERNFLQPLFTALLGPGPANLFKVTNDGALFFYRMVLKTIGTTDTSLLSYVETDPDRKKLLPIAFTKLTTKITSLCVPLLGLILAFVFQGFGICYDKYLFHIFLILTLCYLTHALLSPYERVLEVKRHYKILLLAYTPYVLLIIALIICNTYNLMPLLGLFGIIVAIQGVRLVSAAIFVYCATAHYNLKFPVLYSLTLFVLFFGTGSIGILIVKYLFSFL